MKTLALPTADRPAVMMTCDNSGCRGQVKRAPRIVVPSRTPMLPGHAPIRIMTTLHYCEAHRTAFDVSSYWTDLIKRRAEDTARRIRPTLFRLDFEAATVELMLVTTPEYRQFLRSLGVNCVAV